VQTIVSFSAVDKYCESKICELHFTSSHKKSIMYFDRFSNTIYSLIVSESAEKGEINMEQIDFDFKGKEITVRNIFRVSPQSTNYIIIDKDGNELWGGTELYKCKYLDCEVTFMRVIGEPYTDGYMELRIEVSENE